MFPDVWALTHRISGIVQPPVHATAAWAVLRRASDKSKANVWIRVRTRRSFALCVLRDTPFAPFAQRDACPPYKLIHSLSPWLTLPLARHTPLTVTVSQAGCVVRLSVSGARCRRRRVGVHPAPMGHVLRPRSFASWCMLVRSAASLATCGACPTHPIVSLHAPLNPESGMDNSPNWDAAMQRIVIRPGDIPPYHRADTHRPGVNPADRPTDWTCVHLGAV